MSIAALKCSRFYTTSYLYSELVCAIFIVWISRSSDVRYLRAYLSVVTLSSGIPREINSRSSNSRGGSRMHAVPVSRWQKPGYLPGSATSSPSCRGGYHQLFLSRLSSLLVAMSREPTLVRDVQTNRTLVRNALSSFRIIRILNQRLVQLSGSAPIITRNLWRMRHRIFDILAREYRCRRYLTANRRSPVPWWSCFRAGTRSPRCRETLIHPSLPCPRQERTRRSRTRVFMSGVRKVRGHVHGVSALPDYFLRLSRSSYKLGIDLFWKNFYYKFLIYHTLL